MRKQEALKEAFDRWMYKIRLVEEFGTIFNPLYERADYRKNGSIENTVSLALYEGLTKTYPTYKFLEVVSRKFSYPLEYMRQMSAKDSAVASKIILDYFTTKDIEELRKCTDACGYFISHIDKLYGDTYSTVEIEPKFDDSKMSLQRFIERFNISSLYHICRNEVKDKILQQGLTPRSDTESLNHPERVYFFPIYDEHRFTRFASCKYGQGLFTVLRIDTKQLLQDSLKRKNPISIEFDVEFNGNAVYTTSNIPPSVIETIEEFRF